MQLSRFLPIAFLFISMLLKSQSAMTFPEKKDFYSDEIYQIYQEECATIEKMMQSRDVHWNLMDFNYWNRFLWYFKTGTDQPGQILAIFKDGYNRNKHHFCATFQEMIPYVIKENDYLADYYSNEFPQMEQLCQGVLDSYDQDLIQKIEEIGERDQRYRVLLETRSFQEIKEEGLWQKQVDLDVQNYTEIENIIEHSGYPGLKEVGLKNETIAFLVIQHSGLEAIEKYLPILDQAIADKNLDPSVYPFLFDRMKILKGEPQLFGTQYKSGDPNDLYEIHDVENVNERRKKYLLPNIEFNN